MSGNAQLFNTFDKEGIETNLAKLGFYRSYRHSKMFDLNVYFATTETRQLA